MARPAPMTSVLEMDTRFADKAKLALTEPIPIIWFGDSIPEGYGSSTPIKNWPHETQRALQVYFGHTLLNTDGSYKSGMQPLSFKTVSARYAFPIPNWFDFSLDADGTATNQTNFGGARKGTIQAANSKRSWTDTMTSALVRGHFYDSTDRLVIRVDGSVVKTVNAGEHQGGHFQISTPVMTRGVHTVEVEYLTAKTVCEEWFILDGSETKGFRNIEWCKSNTSTYQFTVTSGYGGQYPGKHLDGLTTIPTKNAIGVLEWLTNDSNTGAGKRTAAQYGSDTREIIRMIRAVADIDLYFIAPQPRKPVSQPMVEPWQNYIEEQHVIASEFPRIKVGDLGIPMTADASKDPNMSDGLHLSDVGAKRNAAKTVPIFVGTQSTTTPPGGEDTTKPVVSIVSRFDGATSELQGGSVTGKFTLEALSVDASGILNATAFTGASTNLGALRPKDPAQPNGSGWLIDLDAAELAAKGYEGIRVISTDTKGNGGSSPTMRLTFKAPADTTPPPPVVTDPVDPKAGYGLLVESDLKALVQVREGFNSLHKYGFTGVPGADETVALRAAVADTMKATAGRLMLPAGEILFTSFTADYGTLPAQASSGAPYGYPGLTIQGQGRRKTVLRQIAGTTGDAITIKGRTGTAAGPANNNKVSGARLSDFEIVGAATARHGIYLQSFIDSELEQLYISGMGLGSGVFMARAAFSSDNYDEYFLGNRLVGIKSTANGRCGFESDGQAAVSFHGEDCEAVGNTLDGWRIAGSNVRLTKCDAYGNGVGNASARGFRWLKNALAGSSVDGNSMVGGRSEKNGAPTGYEIEIEAGGGFLLSGVTVLGTGGASGVGVGLKGSGASTVRNLRVDGGVIRGDGVTVGQKAGIIGTDSQGARFDGRVDFDSFAGQPATVAGAFTDNGGGSSFPFPNAHRTTPGGSFEILTAGGGFILPTPSGARFRVTLNDAGQVITTAL